MSRKHEASYLLESARLLKLSEFNLSELALHQFECSTSNRSQDAISFLRLSRFLYSADQIGFVNKFQAIEWVDSDSIFARISHVQFKLAVGDISIFYDLILVGAG